MKNMHKKEHKNKKNTCDTWRPPALRCLQYNRLTSLHTCSSSASDMLGCNLSIKLQCANSALFECGLQATVSGW